MQTGASQQSSTQYLPSHLSVVGKPETPKFVYRVWLDLIPDRRRVIKPSESHFRQAENQKSATGKKSHHGKEENAR